MSEIYCLSCKKKTGTDNEKVVETENGRKMIKGKCDECGTKKSKFISSKEGGNVNKMVVKNKKNF